MPVYILSKYSSCKVYEQGELELYTVWKQEKKNPGLVSDLSFWRKVEKKKKKGFLASNSSLAGALQLKG